MKKIIKTLVFSMVFMVPSLSMALPSTEPTCESMGYVFTKAECGSAKTLECQTNGAKVYCHKDTLPAVKTCEDYGMLSNDRVDKNCKKDTSKGITCYKECKPLLVPLPNDGQEYCRQFYGYNINCYNECVRLYPIAGDGVWMSNGAICAPR